MKKKKIVISGINMVEGGIFTILHNVLQELSEFNKNKEIQVIALVHDVTKFNFPNIQLIEIPHSKKSWLYRLYYEYFYFKKLSKKLKPDVWFSLHDTTPRVVAKKQFVYCHHPTTFFKPTWKDWKFDYKIGIFSLLYDNLFKLNITKNHTVFVQQHWIKEIFEKRFNISNVKVATPQFVEEISNEKIALNENKIHFFYPSFPKSFKNIEYLFEAIKLLPEEVINLCEFHITGLKNNDMKYVNYLNEKYKSIAVNRLKLLNRQTMLKYYNSINYLVFTSKIETWGLPISEAKAHHKNMLLANLPYAKEACGNYENVSFFNLENPKELAEMITEIVAKKHIFQGNKTAYNTNEDLHSWKELFTYILEE
ncbi:glycosyltransferase family 4 protein [Flavobacterium sp. F372]|uniref:Glycosyltransferase n=1 Tax=Flavobacterium bernardetii TaxID=2813823 RepID=A0ABR7J2I0_9FLAO|nr:glycosyltransferase [Flavobacterium bernardetii]MBC5836157.1 glycosyltransferase [Flavobacterium bernardetii]NHF71342.1 glycosyltransferase family 4 protein [Flavobacterium bernardetii]